MSILPGQISKDVFFLLFLSYCSLQILALITWNQDISKIIIASSFKNEQLVEDGE